MIYFVWLKCLAQAFEVIAEVRSLDQDRLNEEVCTAFPPKLWKNIGHQNPSSNRIVMLKVLNEEAAEILEEEKRGNRKEEEK